MENYYVRVTRFLSELGKEKVGERQLKAYFLYDENEFWWAIGDLFHTKLGKGFLDKEKILYQWNKLLFYKDPRLNRKIEPPRTECILFNTSFSRSKRTKGADVLSFHFKDLEAPLRRKGIKYCEYSYIDTRSYGHLEPYGIFDYKVTLPFNITADRKIEKKERTTLKNTNKNWKEIRDDVVKVLPRLCKKYGFESREILDTIDICFGRAFPEAIRDYNTMKKTLQLSKAKAIFLLGHEDRHNIAAVLAARKCGAKALEMHHGLLSQLPEYPKSYPFPDKICVDGKRDYERFVGAGFGEGRVEITGRPRYDKLASFVRGINQNEIRKKYDLPNDKRLLLWAAQTHDPTMVHGGENEINAEKVFSSFSNLPEYHLIVKLHPDENQKAPLYCQMAKKYNMKISILDKTADTNELISVSEAVIMKISTVGIDTILIGKPIIMLEFVKSHDLIEFSKYDFKVVSSQDELINYIKNLNSKKSKEKFQAKRKKFIEERAANFGYASEKVIEVLEDLI